jgi:SAM-dependent methyltransferase
VINLFKIGSANKRNARKNLPICTSRHCYDGITLPINDVEFEATEAQLVKSVQKIQKAWEHLGENSAHFSVITNNDYLPENLETNLVDFWASGQAEADLAVAVLERYLSTPLDKLVCVEYGCGVGRVTMGLASHFGEIHAYDVSSNHLKHAEQQAVKESVKNITFHVCADSFLQPVERCDVFYSQIVFQHNPPPIIYHLVEKALSSLNENGIAIFQIPVYRLGYAFKINKWLKEDDDLGMQMHCLPQHHIYRLISEKNCQLLEVWDDNATGAPERFISKTFVIQKQTS